MVISPLIIRWQHPAPFPRMPCTRPSEIGRICLGVPPWYTSGLITATRSSTLYIHQRDVLSMSSRILWRTTEVAGLCFEPNTLILAPLSVSFLLPWRVVIKKTPISTTTTLGIPLIVLFCVRFGSSVDTIPVEWLSKVQWETHLRPRSLITFASHSTLLSPSSRKMSSARRSMTVLSITFPKTVTDMVRVSFLVRVCPLVSLRAPALRFPHTRPRRKTASLHNRTVTPIITCGKQIPMRPPRPRGPLTAPTKLTTPPRGGSGAHRWLTARIRLTLKGVNGQIEVLSERGALEIVWEAPVKVRTSILSTSSPPPSQTNHTVSQTRIERSYETR